MNIEPGATENNTCTVYAVEMHDQILRLWQAQNSSSLKVLHLDFHCDMRGLLVDVPAQRAYPIWDMRSGIDQGNFITHAILEGRIKSVRWVHDIPGGRQFDVGTVKYLSDLSSLRYRLMYKIKKPSGIPIDYEVVQYSEWTGLNEGEVLDIDWDFFASGEYLFSTVQDRVESFLSKEFTFIPNQVYVCYSEEFSHPSRNLFWQFIERIAAKFNGQVVQLEINPDQASPTPVYKAILPGFAFQVIRKMYYGINLGLRKHGIY